MQIVIFTTGGTIDKVYFDAKGGYEVGAPMVRQILEQGRVTARIPIVELLRKDRGLAGKTIVLTGALQPARFADSDAAFNLGLAVGAVQVLAPGVYITANGQVFPAESVRKNVALNRFESSSDSIGGN